MTNHFTQAQAERARAAFDAELRKANLFRIRSLYGPPEERAEYALRADAALAEAEHLIKWGARG